MEIIEIENLKYVYAQNIYGKYYIPYNSVHRPCPQIILKGGVWEYETLKFIESEYKGGDIIHAGAYFGDFLPFLSSISKNFNVFAFEPVLENYKCSRLNLSLNNIKNVELFNNTLSNTNDKLYIKKIMRVSFLVAPLMFLQIKIMIKYQMGLKLMIYLIKLANVQLFI